MTAATSGYRRILVVQTAFIGDAILTLPLIQVLHREFPDASIDVLAVPRTAEVFRNHPAIGRVVEFDKRGRDGGLAGFMRIRKVLRANRYDLAVVPHRSIRSALLARCGRIPERVGFDRSAGRFFLTASVRYRKELHEIERNISLLDGVGRSFRSKELPKLYPSGKDARVVTEVLRASGFRTDARAIGLAPGTIWNTKRWPLDRYVSTASALAQGGFRVFLFGGEDDVALCAELEHRAANPKIVNLAGKLTLLQSAEAIRRCAVLVSNDSAPMHMAVAVGTPVAAIFGATVPAFGFAPYGTRDVVLETTGLDCRPCSIHGGARCPIGTFDCMLRISPESVLETVHALLDRSAFRSHVGGRKPASSRKQSRPDRRVDG